MKSTVAAAMLFLHHGIGTYRKKISRYIALNEFCRQKFIEGGLPADKIKVKPNCVTVEDKPDVAIRRGFLFVGRLSSEKGVSLLAEAAKQVPEASITVLGEGPGRKTLENLPNVHLKGFQSSDLVRKAMRESACLLMPSIWYENFPRTLVEAFACGLPVIASRLGTLPELVQDGVNGILFEYKSSKDLSQKIQWAQTHPEALQTMGMKAKQQYQAMYSMEMNYRQLISIYNDAIAEFK